MKREAPLIFFHYGAMGLTAIPPASLNVVPAPDEAARGGSGAIA